MRCALRHGDIYDTSQEFIQEAQLSRIHLNHLTRITAMRSGRGHDQKLSSFLNIFKHER